MRALGRFLAALLSLALGTAITVVILARTVGDPTVLHTAIQQSRLTDQLSTALPGIITARAGLPATATTTAASAEANALAAALSPAYLDSKITEILPALTSHYQGTGAAPTLDLTDLTGRLTAAGYPVDTATANQLAQPISLAPGANDARLVGFTRALTQLQWIAPLISLILILVIVFVMRERRLPTLARALILTAITTALTAGLLYLAPNLVATLLGSWPELGSIAPALTEFIRTLMSSVIGYHLAATGILLVAALVLALIHSFGRIKARFTPAPKPPKDPPQPPGPITPRLSS